MNGHFATESTEPAPSLPVPPPEHRMPTLPFPKAYLVLVAFVALVGAIGGAAIGDRREVTYTSRASVQAGRLNVLATASPGYVESGISLASTYSRVTMSDAVLTGVAKRQGRSLADVKSHLSAVPIPGDPVFNVIATGSSAAAARQLTTAATNGIITFVSKAVTSDPAGHKLLVRFEGLSREVEGLRREIAIERRHLARLHQTVPSKKLSRLQVRLQVASLRADTVRGLFITARQNAGGATSASLLSPAGNATDNRSSNIQRFGLVGFLMGAMIGLSIAALVGRRDVIRSHRSRRRMRRRRTFA